MSTLESIAADPAAKSTAADTGRLDGASRRRIFSVLALIVLFTEVIPLQYSMVSPALQKMSPDFPTVGANISWAVIIIGLVGASATPLLGKASDIWGKKLLFLLCGLFFLVGCVICAITSNWTLFMIGRGLSSFAVASPFIAYGLIRDLLPRRYIPIGIAIVGVGVGFSGAVAPVLGGYLVDNHGWRSMFWFLAAFTLVLTPLVMAVVPDSKLRLKDRIDPIGAVLLSGGALCTLMYLSNGQTWGWGKPSSFAWLLAGLAMLFGFFVAELRIRKPLVDVRMLLNPKVSVVLAMTLFGVGIVAAAPLALGYMMQTPSAAELSDKIAAGTADKANVPTDLVHVTLDPAYTYGNGFTMLEYALHVALWVGLAGIVCSLIAGMIVRRSGGRIPAIIAIVLMTLAAIGFIAVGYDWFTYMLFYVLASAGFAFLNAAVPNLLVDAVPAEQQGVTTGLLGVVMSLGTGVAMAVMTAMQNSHPVTAHIDVAGRTAVQPISHVFGDEGYSQGFWVILGGLAIALVLAVLMRHGRKPATGGA